MFNIAKNTINEVKVINDTGEGIVKLIEDII